MKPEEIRAAIGEEGVLQTRDGRPVIVMGEILEPRGDDQWVGVICDDADLGERALWDYEVGLLERPDQGEG